MRRTCRHRLPATYRTSRDPSCRHRAQRCAPRRTPPVHHDRVVPERVFVQLLARACDLHREQLAACACARSGLADVLKAPIVREIDIPVLVMDEVLLRQVESVGVPVEDPVRGVLGEVSRWRRRSSGRASEIERPIVPSLKNSPPRGDRVAVRQLWIARKRFRWPPAIWRSPPGGSHIG
jgi:hypothetical protein